MRALGLALLLGLSCSPTLIGDGPRKAVVRHLVDAVILPTYGDFVTKAEELARARCTGDPPTPNHAAAQCRLRAERIPLKKTEAYVFDRPRRAAPPHIDQPFSSRGASEWLCGEELTDAASPRSAQPEGFHGTSTAVLGNPLDALRCVTRRCGLPPLPRGPLKGAGILAGGD